MVPLFVEFQIHFRAFFGSGGFDFFFLFFAPTVTDDHLVVAALGAAFIFIFVLGYIFVGKR